MKETIIKRWFSLKPIESSYWFWKQFIQWTKQLNQWSRKRKKIQEHKDFYTGSPNKMDYVQSLTHSKDFTKNDQPDQVYNTCPQQEYTAHRSNHCWTYNRPRNHTESTVCFKNILAETYSKSQLYRIYCITHNASLHPAIDHCWTYSRIRNHIETHCVFQELPCWNLQQVTVIQNPLYNQ